MGEPKKPWRPSKPDLGGGISHPARFSKELFPHFVDILGETKLILDPFAGTGRVHMLAEHGHKTVGVEIEPEWAQLHFGTVIADALQLPHPDNTFDAIVTSPTYGNRFADKHNASDPDRRRSYTFDIGRQLAATNSGGMQWGSDYKKFHSAAWVESVRVLKPAGLFVLNIKDHIRGGRWQDVTAWHLNCLTGLGLRVESVRPVLTKNLRTGSTATIRADSELIISFQKERTSQSTTNQQNRERLWASPHCTLPEPEQQPPQLFDTE